MPTESTAPLPTSDSLFIGLESYTEVRSNMFFGRDEEIDQLTNLIKSNTLTIVFGKSGTGKTSLLNAGVFPRLRKDYFLPFRIRLEFKDESPGLVTQIKNILKSEIDKYGFKVESYPGSETTLWEYFHSESLWKSVTPILIFDQFEEIFTLARKSSRFGTEELATFWGELADLIENSIPEKLKNKFLNGKEKIDYSYHTQKVKTVFAFREEFLPEFEHIASKIPSLKSSRFRLMPMNGNQAYEVITKTWKKEIDEKEAHKIVSYFVNDEEENKSYGLMEVEPSLLSQVCTFIDKERISEGRRKISSDFLDQYPKEKILHSIYDEVLAESNAAVLINVPDQQVDKKPVNEFLEDKLITDEGYRTKYSLNEIDRSLLPGIDVLKRKYFLRDDGKAIEVTHDVLAPIILEDREARRKAIAAAAARRRANRRALVIVILALIAAAGIWYYIAGRAVADKNEAIKKRTEIQKQIKKDSISLADIKDSIKIVRERGGGQTGTKPPVTVGPGDTSYEKLLQQRKEDSLYLVKLQKQYDSLNNRKLQLQGELVLQQSQISSLSGEKNAAVLFNSQAKRSIDVLQRRVTLDSTKLSDLQKAYAQQSREYKDYVANHPDTETKEKIAKTNPPDTNSLKLRLRYDLSNKIPHNLIIYLIPDNKANAKLIRKSEVYEIGCDANIDLINDRKKAVYVNKDSLYVFYDVKPGKYFVKMCSYYGGYGKVEKYYGNQTIDFEAAPPIR